MLFLHKNPAQKCWIFACISFVNETWYARLDSNQRPSESEFSDIQKETLYLQYFQ